MYSLSYDCLQYLLWEKRWLRSGRPEEVTDTLDAYWYAMMENDSWSTDRDFINSRGPLINDDEENPGKVDHDPTKGNGYCFKWIEAFEEQIEQQVLRCQKG